MHSKISLYADDYGYREESDHYIENSLQRNKIQGCAILANFRLRNSKQGAYSPLFKKNVGVHINFIEGKPISGCSQIPSLVDKRGFFYPFPIFYFRLLLGLLSPTELKIEAEAQINIVQQTKAHIIELNSHQHTHALSPISEILTELSSRNNMSVRSYGAMRVYTWKAKYVYFILRILGCLSYLRQTHIFDLPDSWKRKNTPPISFMSWESSHLDYKQIHSHVVLVIHPLLDFDSNRKYESLY